MSIANHVQHLIFAQDVFIKRLNGDKNALRVDWTASWRECLLNESEWTCLKKELSDIREKIASLVCDSNLCEKGEVGHLRLIIGLLTHTVFHLGVIRVKFDTIKG
jgi:hypothetical protein